MLIPCCRLHSWEDELSTASPTTAFAVKHEGPSRWMHVGSRESKEELIISCRDSPPVGSGSVPRETPMSAELRIVSPSPELCVALRCFTFPHPVLSTVVLRLTRRALPLTWRERRHAVHALHAARSRPRSLHVEPLYGSSSRVEGPPGRWHLQYLMTND